MNYESTLGAARRDQQRAEQQNTERTYPNNGEGTKHAPNTTNLLVSFITSDQMGACEKTHPSTYMKDITGWTKHEEALWAMGHIHRQNMLPTPGTQ
jgi:hypothetical protein